MYDQLFNVGQMLPASTLCGKYVAKKCNSCAHAVESVFETMNQRALDQILNSNIELT